MEVERLLRIRQVRTCSIQGRNISWIVRTYKSTEVLLRWLTGDLNLRLDSDWETRQILRTRSPADNTSWAVFSPYQLLVRLEKSKRQLKGRTTVGLSLPQTRFSLPYFPFSVSPPATPLLFFLWGGDHNKNALFRLVGGFHLFPSVLCGFHWNHRDPPDASAGASTTLLSLGRSSLFKHHFLPLLPFFSVHTAEQWARSSCSA